MNSSLGTEADLSVPSGKRQQVWAICFWLDQYRRLRDREHRRTAEHRQPVRNPATLQPLERGEQDQPDVFVERQRAITQESPPLAALLTVPVASSNWPPEAMREELDSNAQGLLGYVVC